MFNEKVLKLLTEILLIRRSLIFSDVAIDLVPKKSIYIVLVSNHRLNVSWINSKYKLSGLNF